LQKEFTDIGTQFKKLDGDWPSISQGIDEKREKTLLLSSLQEAKEDLFHEYEGNESAQQALTTLVERLTRSLSPDK
jgi:hypothetical protein